MSQPRSNLPSETWTRLLLTKATPEAVARTVATGRAMPWSALLLESCREARTVLDLGSGRGEHAAALALAGRDVTLVDWSEENLRFSREVFGHLGIRGRFCQADMTAPLPLRTASHDVVYSTGVLEFFSDAQIEQVLAESWRVCTDKLIVLVPNALCIAYRVGKWWMERTHRWEWDGEVPFRSLKPYLTSLTNARVTEYSVAPKHAFKFLTGPVGRRLGRLAGAVLPPEEFRPALLRQGYLLVSTVERA